jgi:hypothetical protein
MCLAACFAMRGKHLVLIQDSVSDNSVFGIAVAVVVVV